MTRTIRNFAYVSVLALATCLAIYGTVQATAVVAGLSDQGVAYATGGTNTSEAGSLTCPATGCTASSCHAGSGGGSGTGGDQGYQGGAGGYGGAGHQHGGSGQWDSGTTWQ